MPLAITGPQVCWNRTANSSAQDPPSAGRCGSSRVRGRGRTTTSRARGRPRARCSRARSAAAPRTAASRGGRARPGDDVGAVAVHRHEQGREGTRAPTAAVAGDDVGRSTSSARRPSRQHLGDDVVDDHLRLASVTTSSRVSRSLRHHGQSRSSGVAHRRVDESTLHAPQQRRSRWCRRSGQSLGQPLVALEDLLDDDPGVVRSPRRAAPGSRPGRPGRRGGRSGGRRPIPSAMQVDEQRVGRVEDDGVLDAHARPASSTSKKRR